MVRINSKRQLFSGLCGQRYGIGAIALALCSLLFAQAGYAELPDTQALSTEDDVDMATNELPQDLSPGQSFKDCPDCPQMMVLPAGSFMMGSSGSDTVTFPHEQPQHEVTIAQPFALGVYEVTFAEWDACVQDGGCNGYRPKGRFFGRDWGRAQQPVMRIGWDDTRSYLVWLSDLTGETYRLPSEAEWEYAARASTTTPYYTGLQITQEQANYGRYFVGRPVLVGSYPANPFGLHDMLGNVAEWCEDCWHRNYHHAPTDGSAWLDENCDRHVLRGGDWSSDAEGYKTKETPIELRATSRGPGPYVGKLRTMLNSGTRDVTIGFRVARDL